MLQLFKVNQAFNSLLMLPYALLINHRIFFVGPEIANPSLNGLLGMWTVDFNNSYPLLASFVFIFFLFIQALMVNRLSIVFRIGSEINLLPGLIYLIMCSFFPEFQYLSGLVIGQFFILLALSALFKTYKRYQETAKLFNAGFWVGLATLFYPPFSVALILLIMGGFILKPMKIRDFLLLFNGFLAVFFLAFTYYFITDRGGLFTSHYFFPDLSFNLPFTPFTVQSFVPILLLISLIMIMLVNYQFYTTKKGLRSKKNIDIIYWWLLISAWPLFIFEGVGMQHMILLAIPGGLLLQDSIVRIENQLTAEIVHLFIIAALFFFHYQLFF